MTKLPTRVRPAIVWPGGKSRLLKYILPRIPEHQFYCEPFGGGLAVLLAKPRCTAETINDINSDLINFYRVVRYHREALLDELEFVLTSREELVEFSEQRGLTDIQCAARWFHRNKTCFGGTDLSSFGVRATGSASSRAGRMDAIRALSDRLDKTTIEHVHWERCVDLYDREGTFFFFDPPYTSCEAGAYGVWHDADVQRLRNRLQTLKGTWMVTLNDAESIRAIFAGCDVEGIERARGIKTTAGQPATIYRELLITPAGQR